MLDQEGYDSATGLYVSFQGVQFPPVPRAPSREEALAALGEIKDMISTIPFEGGADRAVALSGFLSAVIRPSLTSAPIHAISAPVAGSGKSMLVDLISIVATGPEAGVIAQPRSEEELEKRLVAALLMGDPIVTLDNCEVGLAGRSSARRSLNPR